MFGKPTNGKSEITIQGKRLGYVHQEDAGFPIRLLWSVVRKGYGKTWPVILAIQDEDIQHLFIFQQDHYYIISESINWEIERVSVPAEEVFREWARDIEENLEEWKKWGMRDEESTERELKLLISGIKNAEFAEGV